MVSNGFFRHEELYYININGANMPHGKCALENAIIP